MKTLIELLTDPRGVEQTVRDATAEYGGSVLTEHQRKGIHQYEQTGGSDSWAPEQKAVLANALDMSTARLEETPPGVKRPGIGVMMVGDDGAYIVTRASKAQFFGLWADGQGENYPWSCMEKDRHATPEEITAWFHPAP